MGSPCQARRCAPLHSATDCWATGRGKQRGRAGGQEPSLNVVWGLRWAVGGRNQGQQAPDERSPYARSWLPKAPLLAPSKRSKDSPATSLGRILPISQKRKNGEGRRKRVRLLCSAPVSPRRLADRGSVCRPSTSVLLAIAHRSRGCRMQGARTRWRGVGRDWALWALRGAAAPNASRGSRWGRGVARRWGAEGGGGRHT